MKITRRALQREVAARSLVCMLRADQQWRRRRRVTPGRRRRTAAFWHVAPQRLVVAVLARTRDEPLLVACAAVHARSQIPAAMFAPGVIEAARAAAALATDHVVALDEAYCSLSATAAAPAGAVPVLGAEGLLVSAPAATVEAVVELFADARLRLVALDSAECARMSLAAFLGGVPGSGAGRGEAARPDPLAAVSVVPECEATAIEVASWLVVPVGMALGWYGLLDDAEG